MVKVKHLVLGHPGHLPERLFSSIKTKYQRTMIGMYITNSAVLMHGHTGQLPGCPTSIWGPML